MLRLRPNYLLVFAVTHKRKYKGFHTPQIGYYADYYQHNYVWIAEMGGKCALAQDGVGVGDKCMILDTFELDSQITRELMEEYGSQATFKDAILKEAKLHGGIIEAFVIHENSLIGVLEGEDGKDKLSGQGESVRKDCS